MNTTSTSDNSPKKRRFGFWGNLPLRPKLLVAFGALALLALVVGVIAYLGLNSVKNSYEHALSDGEALKSTSLSLSNNL
ncbi:MAG: hypothetical protein MUO77_14300, partial [Anaerolineales bacterium]|nr:hypothetical protein [Anaerolineales bacterium]